MNIHYTNEAIANLKESLDLYYLKSSENFREKIIISLFDSSEKLIRHPYLGKKELFLEHLKLGDRCLIAGDFKIIYKLTDETIIVTDFFHSHRNPKKMKA